MSGRIDVCKNSLKTHIKTVVLFSTVCKVDQNICSWAKNMPVLAGRLVVYFGNQCCDVLKFGFSLQILLLNTGVSDSFITFWHSHALINLAFADDILQWITSLLQFLGAKKLQILTIL